MGRRGQVVSALAAVVMLVMAHGVTGVQITALRVPTAVRNGSASAVLDCEYSLRAEEAKGEAGLVVKWYFNNGPSPVYQWIPGGKPQDLGVLRGRLDLRHRATDHRATMHRALYIVRPTTDLSGEYKCHVSTFLDEDFMTKKMVVFAPQQTLQLTDSRSTSDAVNLSCQAQGVYPEPKIALYRDSDQMNEKVSTSTARRGGVFDITASALVDESTLESPTVFDCELRIPEVNYQAKKSIVYYGGIFSTPAESGAGARHPGGASAWLRVVATTATALTVTVAAALAATATGTTEAARVTAGRRAVALPPAC